MTEKKKVGAPRKTPEGGRQVTFYLPREVAAWIRGNGGARWIREQAYKAMEKKEKTKLDSDTYDELVQELNKLKI